MGGRSVTGALAVAVAAAGLAACGSGSTLSDEPSGSYRVDVTRASFTARQHISAATDLVLAIRNDGTETIPELAVTVWTGAGGVGSSKAQGAFSTPDGPVWATAAGYPKFLAPGTSPDELDAAPSAGAEAAPTNTYVFGELDAGRSRTIVWRVIPVRAGTHTINYAVAAGAQGGADAVTASGARPTGRFCVRIADSPRGIPLVASGRTREITAGRSRTGRCP